MSGRQFAVSALAGGDRMCHKVTGLAKAKAAGVAQLVESELPKLVVAGSNPVARSQTAVPSLAPRFFTSDPLYPGGAR